MGIKPKELEKIRRDLAKVDALKKALGMKKEPGNSDPSPSMDDFSVLVYLQLGSLTGKIWWLLGFSTVSTALLITILVAVV